MATRLAISNVDAVSDEVSTSVPARLHAAGRFIGQLAEYCFGASSLVVLLAVLATMPVVQLLSLGYLLEASGRVARSGQLCDGFVGIRKAARLGRIALGIAILMLPLWLASSLRFSSRLIDPESRATKLWTVAMAAAAIIVLWQIVTGCLRGGNRRSAHAPAIVSAVHHAACGGYHPAGLDQVWRTERRPATGLDGCRSWCATGAARLEHGDRRGSRFGALGCDARGAMGGISNRRPLHRRADAATV